eukprot:PITA_08154
MQDCNTATTPVELNLKLTSIKGSMFEDPTKYRQLVGSLNFLTTTRPDIDFVVGILSRFMHKPCEDKEDGVSTSGYLMILGSAAISWRSRKKFVLVDSTTEAEFVVADQATQEFIWLRKILEELQEKQKASTPLLVDNSSAIQLAKNPKFHYQSNHINTKYHLI